MKVSAFPYDPSVSADKGIEEALEGFNNAASNPPLKNLAAADPATGMQTSQWRQHPHAVVALLEQRHMGTCSHHWDVQ